MDALQTYFRRFDVTENVTKPVKTSVNQCKTGTRNPNILCVNSTFTTKYWGFQILAEKERFEFREVDFNPSYPFYMFVQLRFGLDSVNFLWRKKP